MARALNPEQTIANMGVRVYGPQIKQAVLAWVKAHLQLAGDIEVSDTMMLDGISRTITDDDTYIYVNFNSEKKT